MLNIKNLFAKKVHRSGDLLTIKEIDRLIKNRMVITDKEFTNGYNLIKKYPRSVSILGSARFKSDNIYYQQAESLGRRIVQELKYAVVTGGGPGIMEAANKGAYEAGGVSIGFAIKLPKEQATNIYLTEHVEFEYFFSRKTLLFFSAETYIYYPGGFGTMDELFEIVTLIQTSEIPKVPVILVGREFWTPLLKLIDDKLYHDEHTINLEDENIYKIVDSEDEIIQIIKNAPFRQE
jgi:uncharacterized protein (TIGR00730 family)